MRYIMRRSCLFLVMIAVIVFTGCGQKKKEDPVTVTLWHVYGGQTESPLNDLIDEFNETIGKEENIRVQVGSVTNTNTIHENVLASAFGDPGASKLPDMFVSYPKTVLAMPDDTELVDYYDYFTEEELNEFIPAFLEEGVIHERLSILPVAKSTEVMFINKTIAITNKGYSGEKHSCQNTSEQTASAAKPIKYLKQTMHTRSDDT